MIVISGALVLVALVLLVLGLGLRDLAYVYGSIAVSLVSFGFLVIGVLQRRGDDADLDVLADDDHPAPAAAEAEQVPVAAADADPPAAGSEAARGSVPLVLPDSAPPAPEAPGTGVADPTVVVIPQRSRFHVPQCRFVRDVVGTESLARTQAEQHGYQPCSVCRP